MENYYFNPTELWISMNQELSVFTRAVSSRYLPPISMMPLLRLRLLSKLQNYLAQWEKLDNRIHPNVPTDKKWIFDRIGNILRSVLLQLYNPNISGNDLCKLSNELKFVHELSGRVDKEFFWYVTTMSNPTNSTLDPWNSRNRFSNYRHPHLPSIREGAMANYVRKLREILDIHERNAIDLLESIAIEPGNTTYKRKYEKEITNYKLIAKQLNAKGEKIDDTLFDQSKVEDRRKKSKAQQTLISRNKDKSSSTSSYKTDKDSVSKAKEQKAMNKDVASIRDSIVECLEPFKKNIAIDAHELLKNAIESRFEILLFRVNHIIDEREQIGEDSYYVLEAAKMLDMSVRSLRQPASANKSREVSSFLMVAVDMLDK